MSKKATAQAGTAMLVLLAALCGPTTARGAANVKSASVMEIDVVEQTTIAGGRLVAVGCDKLTGKSQNRIGRLQVVQLRTAALAWEDSLPKSDSCLWNVVVKSERVYSSGFIADDDGDRGNNFVVQGHRLSDGTLLWRQEFEAPNPSKGVVRRVTPNQDLKVAGPRVIVSVATPNNTFVLVLDAKTGASLP